MSSIEGHLCNRVLTECTWRENFTDPIRSDRNPVAFFLKRKPCSFPAGQVGRQNVFPKPDFRLNDKNPSSRSPSLSELIRCCDCGPESSCAEAVFPRKTSSYNNLSVNDLSRHVFRDAVKVLIGCFLFCELGHWYLLLAQEYALGPQYPFTVEAGHSPDKNRAQRKAL